MAYLPKTRVFDGKKYKLHDEYLRKGTAGWEVAKLRSKGWSARVVKILGLYGVYKRRS